MNIGDFLTAAAMHHPQRVALIWEEQTHTYEEFNQRVNALALGLRALGVQRGDRVSFMMWNCPEMLEGMFATWKLGACVVPLNARFTADEVAFHLSDSQAKVIFVSAELVDLVQQAAPSTVEHIIGLNAPADILSYDALISTQGGQPFTSVMVADDDLAWLAYTSGTTGRPKGAMLTHGVLTFTTVSSLADHQRLEVEDVGIHASPLSHGAGHQALAYTMKACTQVLLQPLGFDPKRFLEYIQRYGVTSVFLVPTQIKILLNHPDLERTDLSSFKRIIYGGSPMYIEDLKLAIQKLGHIFVQIYGQTESPMTGTYLRPLEHVLEGPLSKRLASCGHARSGVEIRIVGENDEPLPPGGIGEICIQGSSVMKGYWGRPEANRETLRGGWLHTGDIGSMDEDGYFYILDRTTDMVISGGLNIYPREIEEVLLTHPAISEACVFGVPDEKWGEAVKALLVLHDGASLSEQEVIQFASKHLAGYKKPKSIEFVAVLPKSAYGKVNKRDLKATYWAGRDRMVN